MRMRRALCPPFAWVGVRARRSQGGHPGRSEAQTRGLLASRTVRLGYGGASGFGQELAAKLQDICNSLQASGPRVLTVFGPG